MFGPLMALYENISETKYNLSKTFDHVDSVCYDHKPYGWRLYYIYRDNKYDENCNIQGNRSFFSYDIRFLIAFWHLKARHQKEWMEKKDYYSSASLMLVLYLGHRPGITRNRDALL